MARPQQRVKARKDVVATNVGDPQVVTAACNQFAGCGDQPGGVESARVDYEPDPVGDQVLERGIQMLQEGGRIALGAVFGPRLAEDQHRDLGEVVAGEDVDPARSCHVSHRRGAVPVEARAVSDTDWALSPSGCCCHLIGHFISPAIVLATLTVPSNPASPDACCSVTSRVIVSPSVAVTLAV